MTRTAVCLMGPTASGKTDIAVGLCERLPFEIISVDSALVYRGMDIGTAKPPKSREFRSSLPEEIRASTDVSFQESIPKGYQRIVKSYFSEIAKTS